MGVLGRNIQGIVASFLLKVFDSQIYLITKKKKKLMTYMNLTKTNQTSRQVASEMRQWYLLRLEALIMTVINKVLLDLRFEAFGVFAIKSKC